MFNGMESTKNYVINLLTNNLSERNLMELINNMIYKSKFTNYMFWKNYYKTLRLYVLMYFHNKTTYKRSTI